MEDITKYHGLCSLTVNKKNLNNIIFLDIDGVLVNRAVLIKKGDGHLDDGYHDFDDESLRNLEYIIDATNANIVISSTWRKRDLDWIREVFKLRGFKYYDKIIGETCRGYHFTTKELHAPRMYRGNEIDAWIRLYLENDESIENNENKLRYRYVIIDDDSDMLYWQRNNFIKTYFKTGLSKENALNAVKILTGFSIEE